MPINGFLYPGAKFIPPYEVANSVRYNDDDSPSMYKTPGSSGNRRTWTFSTWFKRGNLSSSQWILDAYGGSNDEFHIYVSSGNAIGIYTIGGGFGNNLSISTNNLVRDVSAWYHLVVRCDTTQSTASDRLRIYLNGVEATYGTYNNFTENGEGQVNEASTKHWLGRRNAGDHFDGYMAETVLVDGLSLAPTSFGEFDSVSPTVWKPIDVSGLTFGTNGFYLDYEDSSNLGNDANGGTDFTEANLDATDQSTDTCTNNFATLNPLNVPTSNAPTFSEGNLKTTCGTTGGAYMGSSTIGVSSGKWYAEMKVKTIDSILAGVSANASEDARDSSYPGAQDDSAGILLGSGNKYLDNNGTTHGDAFSADDILMIALDLDNNNVYFGRNGNWFDGSGNADESSPNSAISLTAAGSTADGFYFFSVGDGGGSAAAVAEWNFGSPPYSISSGNADANGHGNFEYSVPSGYFALCSKNLAEFG
tara:strand:+ start:611 stop:2035 length:1425 start_codon:yes stop_codon:yes gene_type:complete